jgi:hypothetical protein
MPYSRMFRSSIPGGWSAIRKLTVNVWSAIRAPGHGVLSGARPAAFPRTPLPASAVVPSLRSGQVSLDEAEHFPAQSSRQRRYAPMVFGIIPECRSASFRKERSASPEFPRRRLSWKETAECFRTSCDKAFDSVEHAVGWGTGASHSRPGAKRAGWDHFFLDSAGP